MFYHITIDGKRYDFTWQNMCEMHDQNMIHDAINALENHTDYDTSTIPDKVLIKIGEALADAIYSDNGDKEYSVLTGFGKFDDDGCFELKKKYRASNDDNNERAILS